MVFQCHVRDVREGSIFSVHHLTPSHPQPPKLPTLRLFRRFCGMVRFQLVRAGLGFDRPLPWACLGSHHSAARKKHLILVVGNTSAKIHGPCSSHVSFQVSATLLPLFFFDFKNGKHFGGHEGFFPLEIKPFTLSGLILFVPDFKNSRNYPPWKLTYHPPPSRRLLSGFVDVPHFFPVWRDALWSFPASRSVCSWNTVNFGSFMFKTWSRMPAGLDDFVEHKTSKD